MRTPPGTVTSYGLSLNPLVIDPTTGKTELVIDGLSEFSLPYLRRFVRLWPTYGGDAGQLARFYHSVADKDPVGHWPTVGNQLLTKLALASRLRNRITAYLVTISSWWTVVLDA